MGSKSPAPTPATQDKTQFQEIASRGRDENQRGRKLTGDDVLVVKNKLFFNHFSFTLR